MSGLATAALVIQIVEELLPLFEQLLAHLPHAEARTASARRSAAAFRARLERLKALVAQAKAGE
jgi:hypothetical protein